MTAPPGTPPPPPPPPTPQPPHGQAASPSPAAPQDGAGTASPPAPPLSRPLPSHGQAALPSPAALQDAVPSSTEAPTGGGKALPPPFVAIVGYTLRACLPAKRWFGVLLPCLGAVGFGWLATIVDAPIGQAWAAVARNGLFGLVLPLTCLVIGDAVLGADLRAGTFGFTWLSPVSFATIAIGRWLGGFMVALVTLVPALVLATVVAGVPEGAGAMAVAAAAGSAAYIGLFVMLGVVARRSAVWALAIVFLGERLIGGVLSGIAQVSPMWEAQQVYAGLADGPGSLRLLREGTPNGWAAVIRLVAILVVTLAVATWRLRNLRPTGGDE
jgi:hypothetical protein